MNSPHFEGVEDTSKGPAGLEAPCGCLALDDAEKRTLDGVADADRWKALRLQRAWNCPALTGEPPDESVPLPPIEGDADRAAAIESVRQIQNMTGIRCVTCPRWYTARSRVLRASELYADREKGCFNRDETDALVVQEIAIIGSGFAAEAKYTRKCDAQRSPR